MKRSDLLLYAITVPLVFIVLLLAGIVMRLNQADVLAIGPTRFYALMTLHGLGMVGTLSVGATAGLFYLLKEYVEVRASMVRFLYVCYVLAVVGLLAATLLGNFGPGWYMLYPLPFDSMGVWTTWSVGVAIIALMILDSALLLSQYAMLSAIVKRYGFANAMGWQYLRGTPAVETPAPIIIAMCSYILPGIATSFAGSVLLIMYLGQWIQPSLHFNPLFAKNLVMLWGHTMANISLYVGVAFVYRILPLYTGRPWTSNRYVALAWNAVFFFVLLAFPHHLYQDFAEPFALAVVGQLASYASAVPSTVVTVMGVVAQIYQSNMKWSFAPLAVVIGIIGWIAGGFAAVVDSTILVNNVLHNTLFVPAHFHTYYLLGLLPMLIGYFYHALGSRSEKCGMWGLSLLIGGSFGFLAMFFIAGSLQVPRRYSDYNAIPLEAVRAIGQNTAAFGAVFAVLILVAVGLFLATLIRKSRAADASAPH